MCILVKYFFSTPRKILKTRLKSVEDSFASLQEFTNLENLYASEDGGYVSCDLNSIYIYISF